MAAKFAVPALPSTTVVRQRLLDRVAAAVHGPLTLVSAPAGSGKSVLLASWAATGALPGPLVWITLSPGDERPGTFWSYVLAGLDRIGRPVRAAQTPSRADSIDDSFLIRLAAHLYESPEPVVLVLDEDEADVLAAPGAVPAGLDFLLRHARPQLRLVLVGRTEPALQLHRYRLSGSMTEIRLDELAFTAPEATELLAAHGISLSESSLDTLVHRTRGWPASLRLAAMSLQHTSSADVERSAAGLAGDRGPLADYFLSELLRSQPADLQAFLLRTGIADHLPSALAAELSGRPDAAWTLASLARANALIDTCSEHEDCYRYHPLFAEMLRAQLTRERPDEVDTLRRTAARWLAAHDSLVEAVRHFSAAGEWSAAAALLTRQLAVGDVLAGPRCDVVPELLANAPEEPTTAQLAVLRAAFAARRLDRDECDRQLARAAELMDAVPAAEQPAVTLVGSLAAAVSSRLAGNQSDALRAMAAAETALETLTNSGWPVPPTVRAAVRYEKGVSLLWSAKLGPAAAELAKAARIGRQSGVPGWPARALGQLALVEVVRGRLTRAVEAAEEAEMLADSLAIPEVSRSAAAAVALACVRSEECDPAARTYADRATARETLAGDAVAATILALVRIRLVRARGNLGDALAIVEHVCRRTDATIPTWLTLRLWAEWAVYEAARGRVDEPLRLVGGHGPSNLPCVALATAAGELARGRPDLAGGTLSAVLDHDQLPLDLRVSARLLRASMELRSGEPGAARLSLDQALRLAAPERLRRPVLDAAPDLRAFLRRSRELTTAHPWLQGVGAPAHHPTLSRPERRAEAASPLLVLPLSDKEREVLGHLSSFLSTDEIARAMFVSVNTVKTHVRSILRKLAVPGRNEAVRRARELELI